MGTSWVRRAAGIAVTALLAGAGAAQEAGAEARILEVRRREETVPSANPIYRRMPKYPEPRGGLREIFAVRWAPPPAGLDAGVNVRFEYRQARAADARALTVTYPFAVRGPRTATFVIPERAVEARGRVAAWRVTVWQRGRLLAQADSSQEGRPGR